MRQSFLARFHGAAAPPGVGSRAGIFCRAASQTRIFAAHQWGGCIGTMRKQPFRLAFELHRLEIATAIVYPAAMLRKFILALVIGAGCVGVALAEPRSGIDISAIDPTVRPQDDFWQFANGKWLAATSIPADRAAWDTFSALRETTQQQLRDVIEAIDPRSPDGGEPRKLADFYGSFMDEARVGTAGPDGIGGQPARDPHFARKDATPPLIWR